VSDTTRPAQAHNRGRFSRQGSQALIRDVIMCTITPICVLNEPPPRVGWLIAPCSPPNPRDLPTMG